MNLNIAEIESGLVKASLSGRMDLQGALAVDKQMESLAHAQSNVIVDMSEVAFLASLGIRTLVTCCKILAAKGGGMVLLSPQTPVEKVLVTSGVSTVIPIAADMAAAKALLGR
jgi:anti-sigma B factor antagonist